LADDVPTKPKKVVVKKPTKEKIIFYQAGVNNNTMEIRFGQFFGPEAVPYENHIIGISQKKAYKKGAKNIAQETNTILNRNLAISERFMYRFYSIKRAIDGLHYQGKDVSVFFADLHGVFDIDLIEVIRSYVARRFRDPDNIGDVYDDSKKRYEAGTTFLVGHLKALYTISRMVRMIIPLCVHYLYTYSGVMEANRFLVQAFVGIFQIEQMVEANYSNKDGSPRKMDLYQKLYTFIQRKVEKTIKNDSMMWERQGFFGVNPRTAVEDIMNKLLTNIIADYSFDQPLMSLNSVMIKTTVSQYILRRRDPYSINSIVDSDITTSDDDAVITEAEVFDSYNNRRNEFSMFVRRVFNHDTVEKIAIRNEVIISPEEFAFYHENLRFHQFQTFAVTQMGFSYFGGIDNVHAISKNDYIGLLVILVNLLRRTDNDVLVRYVTGKRSRHYINKHESRSFKTNLFADPQYQLSVEGKYKSIQNVLKRNNFIENLSLSLVNNEYILNMWDQEGRRPSPDNGKVIPCDENEIRDAVLKFFGRVIL
jgi:hypothetical protein